MRPVHQRAFGSPFCESSVLKPHRGAPGVLSVELGSGGAALTDRAQDMLFGVEGGCSQPWGLEEVWVSPCPRLGFGGWVESPLLLVPGLADVFFNLGAAGGARWSGMG